MLLKKFGTFRIIPEINPPVIQDDSSIHLSLKYTNWNDVLVTDNPMGIIRVSPYAFAARITHDVPTLRPIVVTSTRDRNLLAIDSEIRGAVWNGVQSFLVVSGDTLPAVDHYSTANELTRHLKGIQENLAIYFELGMTARWAEFSIKKRIEMGAEYFVVGPVLSPKAVVYSTELINPSNISVPLYLGIIPPFSYRWVDKWRHQGGLLAEYDEEFLRNFPVSGSFGGVWEETQQIIDNARLVGYSGVVLMGMKLQTVIEASTHLS